MKIKNGNFKIYKINKDYLEYLSKLDKNVRQKYQRKYYGILVTRGNIDYCIPFTSKIKKRNSKLTIDIIDNNKIIAQLTLNNMIPVNSKVIELLDISKEKYKDYLNKEIRYLRNNKVKKKILEKSDNLFYVLNNSKHIDYEFFKHLCPNYKLLEKEAIKWLDNN